MLPGNAALTICLAHAAYRMQDRFALRNTGIRGIEVRDRAALDAAIAEADVLVVSGLWRDALIPHAPRLRLIQSISAGVDQYGREALHAAGIRLASAQGANARAVAEHAMALILALVRRLPEARDNQGKRVWRGMIGDLTQREDELSGKTLLIVGLGRIGGRLAQLARAFDLKVVGIRRDPAGGLNGADAVHGLAELKALLPQADIVALTCPLTPETEGLIDAEALALMRPSAHLVNVARGRVCVEMAVVAAMAVRRIAGAALDCTEVEPLAADSPLWAMPNVLITPHTAGETRRYEDSVIDLMLDNVGRLQRGEHELRNQIV